MISSMLCVTGSFRYHWPLIRRFCTSLRDYVLPEIHEKDLEEQFIHGSGPGGQKVNKSSNCVLLKHTPTGLVVKVHDSRSVFKNREIARQRLQLLLDNHLNGENSFTAQTKRMETELAERRKADKEQRNETRERYKKIFESLVEEEKKKMQIEEETNFVSSHDKQDRR